MEFLSRKKTREFWSHASTGSCGGTIQIPMISIQLSRKLTYQRTSCSGACMDTTITRRPNVRWTAGKDTHRFQNTWVGKLLE